MRTKTAQTGGDYPQYAGYGDTHYNPGIDDPTQLPPQFYNPPSWDPYAWPKWALPTGLIAGGLLGYMGLKGLGRRAFSGRGAANAATAGNPAMRAAEAAAKHGSVEAPPAHIVLGLSRIVRGG